MSNTEPGLTTTSTTLDKSIDNSDLLSMLNIVDQLYNASCGVINSHSAAAVLMSLAVEVQTLLIKLRAMRQRWTVHLPFKEAITVDFIKWSCRAKQLSFEIHSADRRTCLSPGPSALSSHYLLDLYNEAVLELDETVKSLDTTDPRKLLEHHAAMQEKLTAQREQCVDAISQLVSNQFSKDLSIDLSSAYDLSSVRSLCSDLLMKLSEELDLLHEQLVKIFTPKDYERLADRILFEAEYEAPQALREARDIMHNWRNGVPSGKLDESRKEQIELTKEKIRHTKHGVKLEQYVNFDADFYSQRSEFGRFLYNRRRNITHAELRELLLLVFCVYYYQKDALPQTDKPVADQVVPDEPNSEENPTLPVMFNQNLRENKIAVKCLYSILRKVEPYINNKGNNVPNSTPEQCAKYKDWSWYHLETAFEHEKLSFLPKNSSKKAFATFIHSLFSHRSVNSVQRSAYRNTNVNSPNIVEDVVKEFQPVLSLMNPSKDTSNK